MDTTAKRVVSQAGAVLLVATAGKVGLDRELSQALAPWRKQWAVLDPGKILLDLAISVAIGGDCLADMSVVRAEPAVFGRVASDPTVSRLIDALAATPQAALAAINQARAVVRGKVWQLAGTCAPDRQISAEHPLTIDLDAALITAHSDKEQASPGCRCWLWPAHRLVGESRNDNACGCSQWPGPSHADPAGSTCT